MKKTLALLLIVVMGMSLFAGCSQPAATEPAAAEEKTAEETSVEGVMVSTEDFKAMLEEADVCVVDTRSTYAFNGWALEGEERGGHIQGATVFEAAWLDQFEDDAALQTKLDQFGITQDKKIVTYGYGTESAQLAADKLESMGYADVAVYADGYQAWAADSNLPVSAMAHYENLVYPAWVQEHMADENFKLFEASWGPDGPESYIPGAAHINTDDFEEGPLWNRKADTEIEKSLLSNGVTNDMTVVLYGADITAAARIALIMKYAGVEDVRLLDGGTQGWTDAGLEMTNEATEKTPVEAFGVAIPQHPEYIDDMPQAKELLADENGRLISIRSWVEYIGETSGYDYIEAAGRIPGAVYGYAGSDPWHMEDYRNIDNTMVNYEFVAERWANQDILPAYSNAFYCGTGWRAAETWFYALSMGWEDVAVYDGGWKEWSEDPNNEIAVGEPKSN